jgi:hypothetical protein
LVRAWRAFRRWRHARPFWGGLFTLLSALQYYASGHLNPLSIQVHIGPQGFLSYVVPLVLLLCGLLLWFSPGQRVFYGVIAAATAIYGLIGLNLGGFFVGMLLGMLGGALGASWTPLKPPATEGPEAPPPAEATGPHGAVPEDDRNTTTLDDVLGGSPLTDTLPRSTVSPLHQQADEPREPDEGGGPAGDLPRRTPRITGLSVILVLVLVLGVVAGVKVTPASAAPCPAPTPTGATPSASPSASPTGDPTSAGNPVVGVIDGLLNGIARLFGGGTSTPSPSASPSSGTAQAAGTPADCAGPTTGTGGKPTPTTGKSAPGKPGGKGSASPKPSTSAGTTASRNLAPAPDQPPVPTHAATLTTDTLIMTLLTFDGVVDLPLKSGGTVRVLQFSMADATNVPFELDMTDGGPVTAQVSSKLEISGHVKFYCTRMQGKLGGIIPQTYTPDSLPPLPPGLTSPIPIVFTGVTIDLVFVHADTLSAANLHGFNKS